MGTYKDACNNRQNWTEDPEVGAGEVTYLGRYAVVTGLPHDFWEEDYGTAPEWVSLLYVVGEGVLTDPGVTQIAHYEAHTDFHAKANHYRLLGQASNMDLLEVSHGW